jgi:hypothetical protein
VKAQALDEQTLSLHPVDSMVDTVNCSIHGDGTATYVCHHLTGDKVGLGFNSDTPSDDSPDPDAWCDDCEVIRAAHGGWNEQSESLTKFALLCPGCYKKARHQNTKTDSTLNELAGVRWKCGSCEEWHTGPVFDISYDHPDYWSDENVESFRREQKAGAPVRNLNGTFLDEDFCAVNGEHYFMRGRIELPILGTREKFCWGVWGSLSRPSMEAAVAYYADPENVPLPSPLFSWLNNRIKFYPEQNSIKMYAHLQPGNRRPKFEIEPTNQPISRDFHDGIPPSRVKEIMKFSLPQLF